MPAGRLPYLVQRFINGGNGKFKEITPNGFLAEAHKLYYDTAQVANRGTCWRYARHPDANILFRFRLPYRTCAGPPDLLTTGEAFDARGLQAVFHDNAARDC